MDYHGLCVALGSARLDPRYADLSLDFTLRDARRAEPVANTVLADWLRDGHRASAAQATAVLVNEDGSLDQARIEALLLRRNEREVRLAE